METSLPPVSIWDRKRDLILLLILVAIALPFRAFLMMRTEVPARDTIGYIRYALQFEKKNWQKVIQGNHQHPGYPLSIFLASIPVRAWTDLDEIESMSLSARVASNFAAVLLVIPMFYLGKLLISSAAGFAGTLLFQCLPVPAHILSDGLSEPLYLGLVCTAFCFAILAFRDHRAIWYVACGAFCGFAYLTRPEGGLILASALFVLFMLQFFAVHRRPWREVAFGACCLIGSGCVVGSPYFMTTGCYSNKPSVNHLMGGDTPNLETVDAGPPQNELAGFSLSPILNSLVGFNLNTYDSPGTRGWKAILGMGSELIKSFHYVVWILALLGLWWHRRRLASVAGSWVLWANCAALVLVLWRVAVSLSYLSDRHLLIIVIFGCILAGGALFELPTRVQCWFRGRSFDLAPPASQSANLIAVGLLALLVIGSLPKSFAALHGNRAGHHAAGIWLAEHAEKWDVIEDQHCWAHYYAGRVFDELRPKINTPAGAPTNEFVVISRREREHIPSPNIQRPPYEEKELVARGARIVFQWPDWAKTTEASVVVYEFPVITVQPAGN